MSVSGSQSTQRDAQGICSFFASHNQCNHPPTLLAGRDRNGGTQFKIAHLWHHHAVSLKKGSLGRFGFFCPEQYLSVSVTTGGRWKVEVTWRNTESSPLATGPEGLALSLPVWTAQLHLVISGVQQLLLGAPHPPPWPGFPPCSCCRCRPLTCHTCILL